MKFYHENNIGDNIVVDDDNVVITIKEFFEDEDSVADGKFETSVDKLLDLLYDYFWFEDDLIPVELDEVENIYSDDVKQKVFPIMKNNLQKLLDKYGDGVLEYIVDSHMFDYNFKKMYQE